MSCNCHIDPCNPPCSDTCINCTPDNPCYQDCGCLNPTTWECITLPGILAPIGVTNNMNGLQVLQSISATIDALTITPPAPGSDVYAKVSVTDTTADYLNDKLLVTNLLTKTVINPGTNEKIRFSVNLVNMISADPDNLLEIGTDSKFRVIASSTPADIVVTAGTGVTVTGSGPAADPFVVSINPSISVVRSCFDSIWRNMTLAASGSASVVYVSGNPQYRYRYDGTVEFRGSVTYTVSFGTYSSGTRKFTVPMGSIPTTCLTAGEQTGTSDLKGINYIDAMQASADQIVQQYGYIIRKNAQNYFLEFQSSFTNATSKTIVVNFEGVVFHPNI